MLQTMKKLKSKISLLLKHANYAYTPKDKRTPVANIQPTRSVNIEYNLARNTTFTLLLKLKQGISQIK